MRSVMRTISVAGAISLAIGLLAGCGPKDKSGKGDPTEGAATIQSIKAEKAAMGYGKGNPPPDAKAEPKGETKGETKDAPKAETKADEKK